MEFAVTYRGQPWTSLSVDVARAEAGESDVEWVEAIALTDAFGVTGPAQLPCLPLRFHVAQKLHGMTLPPRPGKQNERFRDLVDLLVTRFPCSTWDAVWAGLRPNWRAARAKFLEWTSHPRF